MKHFPGLSSRIRELEKEEREVKKTFDGQFGTSTPLLFGASDNVIVNPSAVGTATITRMIESDESIGSAVEFKALMILAKIGEYHHDNDEIADFVNDYLSKMKRPTWQEGLAAMLSAVGHGFSATEAMFGINKDLRKVPIRLSTYHPSTMAFEVDASGQVTENGVIQFVYQYMQGVNPNHWMPELYGWKIKNQFTTPVDFLTPRRVQFLNQYAMTQIPRSKVIHMVNSPITSFGSPYGTTPVRRAHLPWQLKTFVFRQLGIASKKQATNMLWGSAPQGQNNVKVKLPDGREQQVTPAEALRMMIAEAESGDGIVTGPEKDGYSVKNLQNSANLDQMLNVLNNLDVRIFRAFLLPSLVMTDGSAGSRALGDKHFQIVDHITSIEAEQFSQTVINDLIERSIIENFGEQEDYGKFQKRPQTVEERERLANMFLSLCNGGIMKSHVPEDMAYMRSALSLPKDADKSLDFDPFSNKDNKTDPPNPDDDKGADK